MGHRSAAPTTTTARWVFAPKIETAFLGMIGEHRYGMTTAFPRPMLSIFRSFAACAALVFFSACRSPPESADSGLCTAPFTGTWSSDACHCPATSDEAVASSTSLCPGGMRSGIVSGCGALGDKFIVRSSLSPQEIFCVYDVTTHALVAGLSTTNTTSYCNGTSNCIQGGSLPEGVRCYGTSVALPCANPLLVDAGIAADADGSDASDATSVE